MNHPLDWQRWLEEVTSAELVSAPDDILAEARGNLWYLGAPSEPTAVPQVAQVKSLVHSVVRARRRQLRKANAAPMRIYWWHDELAGQLRFSMVSSSHGRLPFGCEVVKTPDLRQVISHWLASPWLRGIPFSSLTACEAPTEESEAEALEPEVPYVLQVWSAELP